MFNVILALVVGFAGGAATMFFVAKNNKYILERNLDQLMEKVEFDDKIKDAVAKIKSKL